MVMSKISKSADAIFPVILQQDYFEDACEVHSLEGDDGKKRHHAICQCKFDSSARLVFSLPEHTKNVYITITDGDTKVIRRVMATLQDLEEYSEVTTGNVVLLNDPILKEAALCGVILLPGSVFNALDHLPDEVTVSAQNFRLLAVVFLTDQEHELWQTQGHDALIDHYSQTDKDLIKFNWKN